VNLWQIRWFLGARSRRARVMRPDSIFGMILHAEHSTHLVRYWAVRLLEGHDDDSLTLNDDSLTLEEISATGYVVCAQCLYRELSLTSDAWHVP